MHNPLCRQCFHRPTCHFYASGIKLSACFSHCEGAFCRECVYWTELKRMSALAGRSLGKCAVYDCKKEATGFCDAGINKYRKCK